MILFYFQYDPSDDMIYEIENGIIIRKWARREFASRLELENIFMQEIYNLIQNSFHGYNSNDIIDWLEREMNDDDNSSKK